MVCERCRQDWCCCVDPDFDEGIDLDDLYEGSDDEVIFYMDHYSDVHYVTRAEARQMEQEEEEESIENVHSPPPPPPVVIILPEQPDESDESDEGVADV